MDLVVQNPWLAVVVPFALAALLAVGGRAFRTAVPWLAAIGPVLVIAVGAGSVAAVHGVESAGEPWTSGLASAGSIVWYELGRMSLGLGWAVDSLAAVMLLVVGVVALMVMVFSAGYMAGDPGWVRYYALLLLFTGSMTLLVIGDSFLALFVGWELVGACSYLLIGFWYEKPSAAAAAIKAFLTTRVGDIGLLLGIALAWVFAPSLRFEEVMGQLESVQTSFITLTAVLVAIGAIGKSAQFPLHIWLPDAMEGPTPVSALIHAATMVAAGVYLVARTWPLFEAAPVAQVVLLTVGVVSALGAALIALVQTDIKKVLAYSTISQLGFMFAALGVGAWEVAFFHLVSHAAFKALLFLGSGSVIHGAGTQDLQRMGGLRKSMPFTFVFWLIGAGALIGIPPLAGFFSKDAVLDAVWLSDRFAGALLFLTVLLTGYYTARATKLAFFGEWRGDGHAHESPVSMIAPLGVLAVPAAVLGFAGPWLAETLGEHPEHLSLPLSVAAVGLGLAGVAIAWTRVRAAEPDAHAHGRSVGLVRVLTSGFGYDRAVSAYVVRPTVALCRGAWAVIDRFIIDGMVEGSALLAGWLSRGIAHLQTGDAQDYVALMGLATILAVCALILVGG